MRSIERLVAFVALAAVMHAALARDGPPRIALVIPGPPNCVKDGLTVPAMLENGIDLVPSCTRENGSRRA